MVVSLVPLASVLGETDRPGDRVLTTSHSRAGVVLP